MKKQKEQVKKIIISGIIMSLGLLFFKYIPIKIFGTSILWDASFHLTTAIFLLYIVWFFIDQNIKWRLPYFILSLMILTIIAIQRIITFHHNELGLITGLIIGILGIGIAERKFLKNKLKF